MLFIDDRNSVINRHH